MREIKFRALFEIAKSCKYCSDYFISFECQKRKYCSWLCYRKSLLGKPLSKNCYDKSTGFKGMMHTIQTKQKIRDSLKEYEFTDSHLENLKKSRQKQIRPVKDTTIEIKIQNYLKQLNINFFTHQYMKDIEHGYQCDIFIPTIDLIIECDGDYWHNYPIGRDIDNIRTKELIDKGFKVLRLWEKEIRNLSLEEFNKKLWNIYENKELLKK